MSLQGSNPKEVNLEISYTRLSPAPQPSNEASPVAPIILLHGQESCHLEYSRITPFLSKDYELILVDLPGHSGSKDICPFTLDNAVNALHNLISTKIAGGRSHIVGLSLGGFVALELARRHPELVLSLLCTGCAPFSGYRRWAILQPRLVGGVFLTLGRLATDSMFWYSLGVKPVPGLREEIKKNQSMALLKAAWSAAAAVTLESLAEIRGVRIAIVAGGKLDSVKETAEAGKVLRSKNAECRAFVVRDAIHWWDLQLPELFAQGVRAWVEGNEMPKQFEMLN